MTDIYKPRFTNGASPDNHEPRVRMMDAASGDASKEGAEREVKDCSRHPSPTHTREELVDCIAKAMGADWFAHGKEGLTTRIDVALDALISIGVVRVK